jgi:hypothetical protein
MATRKTNTALVYNPSRKLTVGKTSTQSNPVKKRRTRRKNPIVTKKVNASSHRRRSSRRRNPTGISGLVAAALVAGIGVSLFDILTTRFLPQGNALVRVGVKLGGAYLFQSAFGSKVPILGKYKNEIALVLAVSGVVDLFHLYAMPLINSATGGFLVTAQAPQMVAVPAADGMGDDYYVVEHADDVYTDEYEEYDI